MHGKCRPNSRIYALHSGGAKVWPDWSCAPAVNPCAPAVPRQKSRRFIQLCSTIFSHFTVIYFTIHTNGNRGQLFGAHGTRKQDFYNNFSQVFRGRHPGPSLREGLPIPYPPNQSLRPSAGRKHPIAGTQTIVPSQWCPTCALARINSWRRH